MSALSYLRIEGAPATLFDLAPLQRRELFDDKLARLSFDLAKTTT